MSEVTLTDLQESVLDKSAFKTLAEYRHLCLTYVDFLARTQPTRIISPSHLNYIFYQYGAEHGSRITRPLNTDLYIESVEQLDKAFDRFIAFLADLAQHQEEAAGLPNWKDYAASREINRVIYTIQQTLGCVADSFESSNQARKRVGMLFETLIKIIIREVGLVCESRTIKLPIPDHPGYTMPYELDLVFSRNKVVIASENEAGLLAEPIEEPDEPTPASEVSYIAQNEIVGSVKTSQSLQSSSMMYNGPEKATASSALRPHLKEITFSATRLP